MVDFRRRLVALSAIVTFAAGLCLPLLSGHFLVDDDTACDTDVLVPITSQPNTIQASQPEAPLEHCAICHWQRAISGAHASARTIAVRAPQPSASVAMDATRTPELTLQHFGASRAPPSGLA
jgi:hypothetical protein